MADLFQMRYEDVQKTSQDFKTTAEDCDRLIADLDSLVQTMNSGWEGQAYAALQAKQEEIKPALKRFSELCVAISGQLDQAGSQIQNDDNTISQNVRNNVTL